MAKTQSSRQQQKTNICFSNVLHTWVLFQSRLDWVDMLLLPSYQDTLETPHVLQTRYFSAVSHET